MKPVDQKTFGDPGGNCMSACIASLLDLSIEDVPYFGSEIEEYNNNLDIFLLDRGLIAITFLNNSDWVPKCFHIMGGRTGMGASHAVVGVNGEMIHNPNRLDRSSLKIVEDYTILVPLDPGEWTRKEK